MVECTFCKIIRGEESAHIVYEDSQVAAFLDKYPQTRGHLQLVPKTHVRWIYELPDIGPFFVTAQKIIRGIIHTLGADHVTIATFGREVAHAHLWILPQYRRAVHIKEGIGRSGVELQFDLAQMLRAALNSNVKNQMSNQAQSSKI